VKGVVIKIRSAHVYTCHHVGNSGVRLQYVTCDELILFKTPCNINYPLWATNWELLYSFNAVQNFRSPCSPPSTNALSLQSTCIVTGTFGSLSMTITNYIHTVTINQLISPDFVCLNTRALFIVTSLLMSGRTPLYALLSTHTTTTPNEMRT
jgi:hypothetical protein